jgi:hypothetical protein
MTDEAPALYGFFHAQGAAFYPSLVHAKFAVKKAGLTEHELITLRPRRSNEKS